MFTTRMTAGGQCPACGARHATCGGPSTTVPVDDRWEVLVVGGPLQRYRHTAPNGTETVSKLNAVDAERLGLTDADLVDAGEPVPGNPAAKARTGVRNKARTGAQDKAADRGGG